MFLRFNFFASVVHEDDDTYVRTDVTIITQVAMHLSIILATIPCAKPFFVIFEGGVFQSPNDQRSRKTLSTLSSGWRTRTGDGHRSDSNAALERAERAAARPTWDRRSTFARPSIVGLTQPERAPTLKRSKKTVSMTLPPLVWNRRKTFAQGGAEEATLPLNASQYHKPSTSSKSDPWSKSSSSRSSRTRLQQYASETPFRPDYQNRGESYNSDRTISRDSSQRTRNILAPVLRPDQGETTTTIIAHDPDALRTGLSATTAGREGVHEERASGVIELRTEVVVAYEDAEHSKPKHKNSVGVKERKPVAS